jgi:serine/threonine-protein kinase
MGNVYLATALGPAGFYKLVAVKELKPEFSESASYVAMFLEEARLAARLNHPNVVQTNEVGSAGGRHYMVMEFLDGRTLHRIRKRLGDGLPLGTHLRIISEALRGLHYLHELRGFDGESLGIVHRDISPLNILVTFDGQVKILDFGIAKTADSTCETKMGVVKGRLTYMAPEQANGARVDRRADIYSAGTMLWEAVAGRRLWPNVSDAELLTRVVREQAPSLRSVQPHAPADLDHICARAMALNPDERYATVADLLRDLDAHLAQRRDAPMMRHIGAFIEHAFIDERRRMSARIDAALLRRQKGPSSGVMTTAQRPRPDPEELQNALVPLLTPSNSFGPYAPSTSLAALAQTAAGRGTRSNRGPNSVPAPGFAGVKLGARLLLIALLFSPPSDGGKAQPNAAVPPSEDSAVHFDAFAMVPAPVETSASARAAATASPTTSSSTSIDDNDAAAVSPYSGIRPRDAVAHPTRLRPATRHATPAQQTTTATCHPPYTVDQVTGVKRWRLECL